VAKWTFWIQTVAVHPVITVSRINPGTLAVTKITFIPLMEEIKKGMINLVCNSNLIEKQ
jgi:hypothetical protein